MGGSLIGDIIELSTTGQDLRQKDAMGVRIGGKVIENATAPGALNMTKCKVKFNDDRANMAKRHVHNRIKFGTMRFHLEEGLALEVAWFTGKKQPNRLDFRASHLSRLGTKWGGILGSDDHTWVSSYEPECK